MIFNKQNSWKRKRKKAYVWETIDKQLGVVSDRKLSGMHKINRVAISKRRKALGISAYTRKQEHDWALIDPLLTADGSISEISLKFNIPENRLYYRCEKLGIIRSLPEIPWQIIDPLLGTVPDSELVQEFNISTKSIYDRRKRYGIPPFRSRRKINWSLIDPYLGSCTDRELAERVNVSEVSIANRRRMLDIPSFSGLSGKKSIIDWKTIDPHLGTMTDKKLADKYKVSILSIHKRRLKMKIKPYTQPVNWENIVHLFNKIPDIEISKLIHVPASTVCSARKRLGMSTPKKDFSFIDQYLDTLSDAEIAVKFSIRRISVYRRRYLVNKKTHSNRSSNTTSETTSAL